MQARELKSVYFQASGNFLKLLLHRCHVNTVNLFNQVGVVAVNVIGALGESGGHEMAAQRRCVVAESGWDCL